MAPLTGLFVGFEMIRVAHRPQQTVAAHRGGDEAVSRVARQQRPRRFVPAPRPRLPLPQVRLGAENRFGPGLVKHLDRQRLAVALEGAVEQNFLDLLLGLLNKQVVDLVVGRTCDGAAAGADFSPQQISRLQAVALDDAGAVVMGRLAVVPIGVDEVPPS